MSKQEAILRINNIEVKYHEGRKDGYIGLAQTRRPFYVELCFKPSDPEEARIATFAHEIGHVMRVIVEGENIEYYRALYKFENPSTLTSKDKELILEEEMRAWEYGRKILEDYGYDLKFYDARTLGDLRTYRRKMNMIGA